MFTVEKKKKKIDISTGEISLRLEEQHRRNANKDITKEPLYFDEI